MMFGLRTAASLPRHQHQATLFVILLINIRDGAKSPRYLSRIPPSQDLNRIRNLLHRQISTTTLQNTPGRSDWDRSSSPLGPIPASRTRRIPKSLCTLAFAPNVSLLLSSMPRPTSRYSSRTPQSTHEHQVAAKQTFSPKVIRQSS